MHDDQLFVQIQASENGFSKIIQSQDPCDSKSNLVWSHFSLENGKTMLSQTRSVQDPDCITKYQMDKKVETLTKDGALLKSSKTRQLIMDHPILLQNAQIKTDVSPGRGFHQKLIINIKGVIETPVFILCPISKDVFADPFEIAGKDFGKGVRVRVSGSVDLEAAAYHPGAKGHIVSVQVDPSLYCLISLTTQKGKYLD